MKKYIYLALMSFVLFSCKDTVVSNIDGNAEDRVHKAIIEYKRELVSAQNGWIINLNTNKGVYRFWADFKEDSVVLMTDNLMYPNNKTVKKSSEYTIRAMQRPTICFATYSYIAVLCDPDNAVSGGISNLGLETSFEYEVERYENDVFYLRGRVPNVVDVTFTKATVDQKSVIENGQMMVNLDQFKAQGGKHYVATVAGQKIELGTTAERWGGITYVAGDSIPRGGMVYPWVDFNKDITFAKPYEISGVKVMGMKWNDTDKQYTTLITSNGDAPISVQNNSDTDIYNIFGYQPTVRYHKINVTIDMFGGRDAALVNTTNKFAILAARIIASYAMSFRPNATTGAAEAFFEIKASSGVTMFWTYPVTFDNVARTIKFGTTSSSTDIVSVFAYAGIGDPNRYFRDIVDFPKNKTFKIQLGTHFYKEYPSCQLVQIDDYETFYPGWITEL